jgi:putative nucleotidyltransferase with HDIG domain
MNKNQKVLYSMNNIFEILKLKNPQVHLLNLHQKGELFGLLPELTSLDTNEIGYKNNLQHTFKVLENVCKITDDYKMKIVALFHDIGKSDTKKNNNNKWTFHNHESVGAELTMKILDRFNIIDVELRSYVYRMIHFHGRVKMHRDVTESAIRRLDKEVGQDIIFDLIEFCKCDITTKFDDKRNRIIISLDTIKDRIIDVRNKDKEAEWRSPLTGNMIMDLLSIEPCRLIGDIKKELDPKLKNGDITLNDAIKTIIDKYKKG